MVAQIPEAVIIQQILPLDNKGKILLVNASTNRRGGLFRSTDYGNTFEKVFTRTASGQAVYQDNKTSILYCSGFGVPSLYESSDQGLTWCLRGMMNVESRDTNQYICTLSGIKPDEGLRFIYGCGAPPRIIITDDTGKTWHSAFRHPSRNASIPCIISIGNGQMYASLTLSNDGIVDSSIFASNNYGSTWTACKSPTDIWSLAFDGYDNIIYCGRFSTGEENANKSPVYYTKRGAHQWQNIPRLDGRLVWMMEVRGNDLFTATELGLFKYTLR